MASGDCFIPRGVAVPALDTVKQWEFHPTTFKVSFEVLKGKVPAHAGRWNEMGTVAVRTPHSLT